jgi:hypothetical protein
MEQCACDATFHLDAALNLARIYFFVWIYIMQSAYFLRGFPVSKKHCNCLLVT